MKAVTCTNCGHEFSYDEAMGLNVAYKKAHTGRVLLCPGLLPICPKCETINETKPAQKDDSWDSVTYTARVYAPVISQEEVVKRVVEILTAAPGQSSKNPLLLNPKE